MKKWKYKYRDTVSVILVYDEMEGKEIPNVSAAHSPPWNAPICYAFGHVEGVECWIYSDTVIEGLELLAQDVEVEM